MNESKIVSLRQKDEIDDPLTDILRCGAKRLVQQAVEAEFAAFLAAHAELELRNYPPPFLGRGFRRFTPGCLGLSGRGLRR